MYYAVYLSSTFPLISCELRDMCLRIFSFHFTMPICSLSGQLICPLIGCYGGKGENRKA